MTMKHKHLLLLFTFISLGFVFSVDAQDTPKKEKKEKKVKEKKSSDVQNQTQYLQPDLAQPVYNLNDRKKISPIMQPKYDQPGTSYQDAKYNKRKAQQQAFLERKYYYPARPKDQWELGVHFGYMAISGDVAIKYSPFNPIDNAAVGIHVRKAFSYIASIRMSYQYGQSTGRNNVADKNLLNNRYLNGTNGSPNYYNNPNLAAGNTETGRNMNTRFFHNYRTTSHGLNLEGVFNLGNIRFHRERNIFNFYVYAGLSGFLYKTMTDALDANGQEYDFSRAYEAYIDFSKSGSERNKNVLKELNNKFDGTYESRADWSSKSAGLGEYTFGWGGTMGAGIQFHVSKWITLGLDQRFIITNNDVLDGYRFASDDVKGFTPNMDHMSYTSIQLLFHLGNKRLEPLYWLNPMDYAYKKIGESDPKAIADELLKDDDEDGVPNRLDKELDTPKDAPVDSKGVALDSDKDGVKDYQDKEPFSPPGYPVDKDGVAIIPPNPCCDNAEKNVKTGTFDCSRIDLPGVYFDEDKYYVSPEYYGTLHQIAERMQMCPDVKLVVTGNDASTANPKYNEQLSWNRVNTAVDYLVNKYGISRDRFIVFFKSAKKAAGPQSEFEKKKSRSVDFKYAGDNENGNSNPPAPHPGLKAGSDK